MTKIEWTNETWNWLVGCSRISPECDRCYAAVAAKSPRLQRFPQYQGVERWDGTVNFVESQLLKPLGWKKPKRVFTCSMSDVFHPSVLDEWRNRALGVMVVADHHTYQMLTKRTEAMLDYFKQVKPLSHIWLGTTAGCQDSVDERLPILAELTRMGWTTFVSAEPPLESINLHLDQYPVSQVIIGAESGRGARPINEGWVRSLRDQCQEAGTAFFYKQNFVKGKKVSLPELDGKVWAEFPKV